MNYDSCTNDLDEDYEGIIQAACATWPTHKTHVLNPTLVLEVMVMGLGEADAEAKEERGRGEVEVMGRGVKDEGWEGMEMVVVG